VCEREMNIRKSYKILIVKMKVRESLGYLEGDEMKILKLILRRCNL
jgi:hypothetical protein